MKLDLHCHSYYSIDGFSSPEALLKTAIKRGLDGIAITDHDTTAGWKEAEKAAKKLNAILILGQEIKTKKGDILGLFLNKEIKSRDPFLVIKEIKAQGGIVIIPHPFHFPHHFRDDLTKYRNLIDGIEVLNSRSLFPSAIKKALIFAQKYNLALVGGSDAHVHFNVGDAFTVVEAKNVNEVKKAILERKTKIEGKRSPLFSLLLPILAKTKNLAKRKLFS